MIDNRDRQILAILQAEGGTSKAEIARRVGLTPNAVFERIKKLEDRGIIRGYSARLDPAAFGLHLLAFVFVAEDGSAPGPEVGPLLSRVPGVEEVHVIAGEDCFLVKIRAESPEELSRILTERVRTIPSVRHTRTTIVLETVAESDGLPVSGSGESRNGHPGSNLSGQAPPNLLTRVQGKSL